MESSEPLQSISWLWNEFKQVGKDYGQEEEVDVYDTTHADFRDVDAENEEILQKLDPKPDESIIEIGCGTGAFSVKAASHFHHVHAADVSEAMLSHAKQRASEAGANNIEFHLNGFLTYQCDSEPVDAVVSCLAMHHLPDFWKQQALFRIAKLLKPGGKFLLRDVVIPADGSIETVNGLIEVQEQLGGDFLRDDAVQHFQEEFSTFDWVMEEMIRRAGFEIAERTSKGNIFVTYLMIRKSHELTDPCSEPTEG